MIIKMRSSRLFILIFLTLIFAGLFLPDENKKVNLVETEQNAEFIDKKEVRILGYWNLTGTPISIDGDATGVDANKAIDFVSELGNEIADTAKEADRLAQSTINARNAIRGLVVESAKQQRIAEENRKLRDDETKTEAERLAFNKLALEAE